MGRKRKEEEEEAVEAPASSGVADIVARLQAEAAEEIAAERIKVARMRELGTNATDPGPGFKQAVASYHVDQAMNAIRTAAIADVLGTL